MPKTSTSNFLKRIVKKNSDLTTDGKILICSVCETEVNWDFKHAATQVSQHLKGKKHQERVGKKEKRVIPIANAFDRVLNMEKELDDINSFIAKKLIEADIPLSKIENQSFKDLLEKLSGKKMPSRESLRNKMDFIYQQTISNIIGVIGDNDIYMIIDETTDIKGRYVCNVLVGLLNGKPAKSMLVATRYLEETNNKTICQTVNQVCSLIWKGDIKYERLRLIVSDQAPYMVKAVKVMKDTEMYPNLHHVTCVVHALHRVCEFLRKDYGEVNHLVASMKKVLLKSPHRKQLFKTCTGLNLPPEVIVTRWGSWLNGCLYFADNFSKIEEFVNCLTESSKAIEELKHLLCNNDLHRQLIELRYYDFIPQSIEKLESSSQTVQEQMEIVLQVKEKLKGCVLTKFESCLVKNPDLVAFVSNTQTFDHKSKIVYAPLNSVDVERSFSRYKNILRDNRTAFTTERLEKYNIIHCNAFLSQ